MSSGQDLEESMVDELEPDIPFETSAESNELNMEDLNPQHLPIDQRTLSNNQVSSTALIHQPPSIHVSTVQPTDRIEFLRPTHYKGS